MNGRYDLKQVNSKQIKCLPYYLQGNHTGQIKSEQTGGWDEGIM